MSHEIHCTACGQSAFVRREPVYDGFRKVGEVLVCTACGHRYAEGESVAFRDPPKRPSVFTEDDKPEVARIFQEDERGRCCRHCRHFVVNPFTQRCGLHGRSVQATDFCMDFTPPSSDA